MASVFRHGFFEVPENLQNKFNSKWWVIIRLQKWNIFFQFWCTYSLHVRQDQWQINICIACQLSMILLKLTPSNPRSNISWAPWC